MWWHGLFQTWEFENPGAKWGMEGRRREQGRVEKAALGKGGGVIWFGVMAAVRCLLKKHQGVVLPREGDAGLSLLSSGCRG